jgi:iron complex outermembrane receptor protein
VEVQLSRTFFEQHHLTLGGEFRWDTPVYMRNADDDPAATWLNIDLDQKIAGVYLQDEWSIRTNLILTLGGRYDDYSSFGSTLNPRTALVYTPWRGSTFKLLYGTAYRAPNVGEWGYVGPGWAANPALHAETIRTYELDYEQVLSRTLSLSAAVFLNNIHGLIDATTNAAGLNYYSNLENAEARGFELGLEGHWAHGLRGAVSYTFADAEYLNSNQPLSNSPRHLAKLNVAVPIWQEKIYGTLEIQGMSSRKTEAGNELPGFAIANVTLFSRELIKHLQVSASIYNLLDKRYSDPADPGFTEDALQQNGRTFRVKATYLF